MRPRMSGFRSDGRLCRIVASGLLVAVAVSGCRVVDVRVANPMPEVRRVAIAPFLNLSLSPDLDPVSEKLKSGTFSDRRFAQAYFAELQKTPGFEVIPVGVVEQAILSNRLPMNGPDDYLAVAEAIGADAICIGAVTDYDPYHPRLGLQVNWYAATSTPPPAHRMPYERPNEQEGFLPPKKTLLPLGGGFGGEAGGPGGRCVRGQSPEVRPLYSYTRFFDGRDAAFTARLRDYVELSGDIRSGGWQSYLNRSDDFIRFCSHLMVEEMLLLHGGEAGRDTIYKMRKQK